ncbi:3-phosphoshikimate 1-carboxyvinyltransferase [Haematomicrobium sanguinis]|uniref:3-phosphoshikimate 1-carboxyvinyltransferase n=1 Tax=Haematomicrobium sanguinis TaxID=479106 RepID=UPI00047B0B52|nr:3-phosphoshikimate 1-carboxyvinyltransferase [Haematomicrobium sanguinis]
MTGNPAWPAPFATHPVDATVSVPGSKSLTNRYLILAALADAPSRLRAPLHSRDSRLMIQALTALGATITEVEGHSEFGPDLIVEPIPTATGTSGPVTIDCGLAGTVMRFVPPLAALRTGHTRFDGDAQARVRPMSTVIDALEELGVEVTTNGAPALPFTVHGTGRIDADHVIIDASKSSQFVSALLLVGWRFTHGLHLEHVGKPLPSIDHIAMTVATLREVGVEVDDSVPNHWRVSPGTIPGFDVTIEPDLSNAGPFLAAALATGGTVRVTGWPAETTQVGAKWAEILAAFGATTQMYDGAFTVRANRRPSGATIADASELAPTVAAIGALASGETRLTGIAHLRGHETDRLAALVTEINRLGGDAEETADGLIIRPRPLHGGEFQTYHDHRMATAGAIIGLAVPGVRVENVETTAKTMPEFVQLWTQMVGS